MTDKQPAGVFSRLMASGPSAPYQAPTESAPEVLPSDDQGTENNHGEHGTPQRSPRATAGANNARTRARVHARADAPTHQTISSPVMDSLQQQLRMKQHLVSQTFRFRADQLEVLDALAKQVEMKHPNVSKNDLVRLGVAWLLADHEERGEDSTLAHVLLRA